MNPRGSESYQGSKNKVTSGDYKISPGNNESCQGRSRFRTLTRSSRLKDGSKTVMQLARPVFLIGFMGAGKTSVARRLARMCGISSVDMDTYIERQQEKSISEIFAESGEVGFRKIETEALREIATMSTSMLVSCGGGVVTQPRNLDILKSSGVVVHLMINADQAAERISNTSTRPLFQDLEAARQLCAERMPVYEDAADYTILTAGRGVGSIAYELKRYLVDEGVLK